jgi:hypothetical protein
MAAAVSDREQLATLPDHGRMRRDPVDTEREAAQSTAPLVKSLRQCVLQLLRDHTEGLTDDQGAELLNLRFGLPYVDRLTFGRRRQELCKAGLAHDSGRRRPSARGRRAIVWRALPPDPS